MHVEILVKMLIIIECPLYNENRKIMFKAFQDVIGCNGVISLSVVLNGNADLTHHENEMLFKLVHSFISKSTRFQ